MKKYIIISVLIASLIILTLFLFKKNERIVGIVHFKGTNYYTELRFIDAFNESAKGQNLKGIITSDSSLKIFGFRDTNHAKQWMNMISKSIENELTFNNNFLKTWVEKEEIPDMVKCYVNFSFNYSRETQRVVVYNNLKSWFNWEKLNYTAIDNHSFKIGPFYYEEDAQSAILSIKRDLKHYMNTTGTSSIVKN